MKWNCTTYLSSYLVLCEEEEQWIVDHIRATDKNDDSIFGVCVLQLCIKDAIRLLILQARNIGKSQSPLEKSYWSASEVTHALEIKYEAHAQIDSDIQFSILQSTNIITKIESKIMRSLTQVEMQCINIIIDHRPPIYITKS